MNKIFKKPRSVFDGGYDARLESLITQVSELIDLVEELDEQYTKLAQDVIDIEKKIESLRG